MEAADADAPGLVFRSLAELSTQATIAIDDQGRISDWSAGAEALFGWRRHEVVGKPLVTTIVPPFYRAAHVQGLATFRATGRARLLGRLVEVTALHREGWEFPVELLVNRIDDGDGRSAFTALVRDITRRRRTELLRDMQLGVSRALLDGPTVSAALPRVLETVAQTLRCRVASIWLHDPARGALWLSQSWHVGSRAIADLLERCAHTPLPQADIARQVWESGLPFVVQEGTPHGNPLLTAAEAAGLSWMAAFPLTRAHPTAGALVLLADTDLLVDEDLLASMGSVCSQVGQALARGHAEDALSESERQYRVLFRSTPMPILLWDTSTRRFLGVNDAAVATYGYSAEDFLQLRVSDLDPLDDAENDRYRDHPASRDREAVPAPRGPYRHRLRDGRVIDVEVTVRSEEFGGRSATLALINDITDRLSLEHDLRHLAFQDSLTGVANRALFMDRLQHAVDGMRRHGAGCAVLLLDLDDFKTVNDSRGHSTGDELLRAVAERLSCNVRPTDTVARFGGDEFAVLLEGVGTSDEVDQSAERILSALRAPFVVAGTQTIVRASMGVTVNHDVALRAEEIVRNADLAMYAAKHGGKGRHEMFVPTMHSAMVERMTLESELREALAEGALEVVYQPQVELVSGRIVGAEALVRWPHRTRGPISPDAFIPLAEETGLIRPLGDHVLRTACARTRDWIGSGLPPVRMSVNLSARELGDPDLVERVRTTLADVGLAPSLLELEITETSVVGQPAGALSALQELRELGVQIAIDDFGTGYSMLSRLQLFPVDKLKIDKFFIDGVTLAIDSAPLVVAMIMMGHGLGLKVVAEGVETPEQLAFLRTHGCDQVQGYLFSRPLSAGGLEELLRSSPEGMPDPRWREAELTALHLVSDMVMVEPDVDRVITALLSELRRLTGLEHAYVTELGDEGIAGAVRWGDASTEADDVHYRTTVPILGPAGRPIGELCGASAAPVELGSTAQEVMRLFSRIIAMQIAEHRA